MEEELDPVLDLPRQFVEAVDTEYDPVLGHPVARRLMVRGDEFNDMNSVSEDSKDRAYYGEDKAEPRGEDGRAIPKFHLPGSESEDKDSQEGENSVDQEDLGEAITGNGVSEEYASILGLPKDLLDRIEGSGKSDDRRDKEFRKRPGNFIGGVRRNHMDTDEEEEFSGEVIPSEYFDKPKGGAQKKRFRYKIGSNGQVVRREEEQLDFEAFAERRRPVDFEEFAEKRKRMEERDGRDPLHEGSGSGISDRIGRGLHMKGESHFGDGSNLNHNFDFDVALSKREDERRRRRKTRHADENERILGEATDDFDTGGLRGVKGKSRDKHALVKCSTTAGSITMHLHRDWSPNGYDRASELFERGYYDKSHFFRVVPHFLVQFGISYSTDQELHRFADKSIKDDPKRDDLMPFREGYMSFAGSGPNSRTSQLFIAYDKAGGLGNSPWETPFGEVVSGMETVRAFYSGYGDMPPWGKGPQQGPIRNRGISYIENEFPKLDSFVTCSVRRVESLDLSDVRGNEPLPDDIEVGGMMGGAKLLNDEEDKPKKDAAMPDKPLKVRSFPKNAKVGAAQEKSSLSGKVGLIAVLVILSLLVLSKRKRSKDAEKSV